MPKNPMCFDILEDWDQLCKQWQFIARFISVFPYCDTTKTLQRRIEGFYAGQRLAEFMTPWHRRLRLPAGHTQGLA
jgi:hypothetical protein